MKVTFLRISCTEHINKSFSINTELLLALCFFLFSFFFLTCWINKNTVCGLITRLSDGWGELAPQPGLQVFVVVRRSRRIIKTLVFPPEVYEQVVHGRTPVWPPDLTPEVCHISREHLYSSSPAAPPRLCNNTSVCVSSSVVQLEDGLLLPPTDLEDRHFKGYLFIYLFI